MRKYLAIFATAAAVLITGVGTKAAYFSGHPVKTEGSVTTLDPMKMHYGSMPVQEISDFTFVF